MALGGRVWRLVAEAKPGRYQPAPITAHRWTLLRGLVLTLLVAAYLASGARHLAERNRREAELRLRERAMESTFDGVLLADARDAKYPIVYVNEALTRITGYAREELLGRSPDRLYHADCEQRGIEEIRTAVRDGREGTALLRAFRKGGAQFWTELHVAPVRDERGAVTHIVGVLNDVTDRIRYQRELEHRSNHDSLTGLANRNLLQDRMEQALHQARRQGASVAILFVDVDRFKQVNDSLGHSGGDCLLREVGERLARCVRAGDTVARLGADEFVLVLADAGEPRKVGAVAQRVLHSVSEPVLVEGYEIVVTASIGIGVHPRDGESAETLLRNAEMAMYQAKRDGPGAFRFYQPQMNERALERLTLERKMRAALEREEFVLHFQPQMELASGRLTGLEALVRWQQADGTLVPPASFIPLAEETGLILPLGNWVLEAACRQNKAWQAAGLAPARMAVNVSARQLHQSDLPRAVERALAETGLDPAHLELELTESMIMREPERVVGVLRELKALGVVIALDDFGTGYSSLAYLKRFPIDRIKIDRSFVRDLEEDPSDATIIRTVIAMSHALGLRVIAEGVESPVQLRHLVQHRCDEAQGYLLSPPLPAGEVQRLLRHPPELPGLAAAS